MTGATSPRGGPQVSTSEGAEARVCSTATPHARAKGFSGTVSPWWILVTGVFLVVFFIAPIVNNLLNTDSLATLAEQRSAGFYYAKLFTDRTI